jgi:hypothetical protein
MDRIAGARARLEAADDLPAILDAAYEAFEDMLTVIEDHQDPGGGVFAAFVMSGAAAMNGQNAVAGAPSLPHTSAVRAGPSDAGAAPGLSGGEAAAAVTGLSLLLVSRLDAAAGLARNVADRTACALAARHAASVCSLLGGAPRP